MQCYECLQKLIQFYFLKEINNFQAKKMLYILQTFKFVETSSRNYVCELCVLRLNVGNMYIKYTVISRILKYL